MHRVTAPMLYAQSAPGRWLANLTPAMDEAAAVLCRACWRQGRPLDLRPMRLERRPRTAP
ncbi:MAG TPA: hypothetical protein VFN79_18465 [Steroidobacteraceae bacterium]|nr:hypothetical protein [Steroidobacteraceae bacterium]